MVSIPTEPRELFKRRPVIHHCAYILCPRPGQKPVLSNRSSMRKKDTTVTLTSVCSRVDPSSGQIVLNLKLLARDVLRFVHINSVVRAMCGMSDLQPLWSSTRGRQCARTVVRWSADYCKNVHMPALVATKPSPNVKSSRDDSVEQDVPRPGLQGAYHVYALVH